MTINSPSCNEEGEHGKMFTSALISSLYRSESHGRALKFGILGVLQLLFWKLK